MKRYEVPARGTSTATGRTPATRCCKLKTLADAAGGGGAAANSFLCFLSLEEIIEVSISPAAPVTVTVLETEPRFRPMRYARGFAASYVMFRTVLWNCGEAAV